MRIERLLLERYGHFTGCALDFSAPEVRLHVVLGANEAGKTTALHAVRDLLFGIDERSPFDFVHTYKDMRVGGEISAVSGEKLDFKRRKGRKSTLLDGDGGALRDDALVPFLGAADRPLFEGLFSLTHESLREGSNDLLAAGGNIGQMLFETGGSIRHLVGVLKRLDDEAAALFAPHRSANRAFYRALDAYTSARKQLRGLFVSSEEWRKNSSELQEAEDSLGRVKQTLADLQSRRDRAERIRRLLPMLADLNDTKSRLSDVEDTVTLPPDSRERFFEARQGTGVASAAAEQQEGAANAAVAELAGLDIPEGVLAMADDIHLAYEKRGEIRKAAEDLPKLQTERQHFRRQLETLVRDLGTGIALDQALRQLPPEAAIIEVRDLIRQASAIEGEFKAARSRVTEAGADLEILNNRLAETPEPPNVAALRQAIDSIRAKGDLDGALSDARLHEEAAGADLRTALSALPLWMSDAEALASVAIPDETTIERFEEDMEEVADRLRRSRERRADAEEKAAAARRKLSRLLAGGDVPTAEAVDRARHHRDSGWRLVRRVHIDREDVADEEVKRFENGDPLPAAYERSVTRADRLADQKESEAARIARHDALRASLDDLEARIAALDGELASEEQRAKQLAGDWANAWSRTGVDPRPPREMGVWLGRREHVLRLHKEWRAAATRVERSREALEQASATINALATPFGVTGAAADGLSVMVARCEELIQSVSGSANQRARAIEQRDQQELAARRAGLALESIEKTRALWSAAWERALAGVGLRAGCSVTVAEQVLATWEKIRTAATQVTDLEYRIQRITEDTAEFAEFVGRIVREAALDIDPADPPRAAAEAFQHLRVAEASAARKRDLEKRRDAARVSASEARNREAAASRIVDQLKEAAGVETDAELLQAIERSNIKTSLLAKAGDLENRIVNDAGGWTIDEAKAEAEGKQSGELVAEIQDIDLRIGELMEESRILGGTRTELETKRKELERGRGAADFAQEMEDAMADLEACAERWMVLKTATFILRRGIERFREEQQGPVLAKARDVFSKLTLGGFVGFQLDYDEHDTPLLLGVRADAATCPVNGMSDGTRDQLFLALRIAAIANYAGSAEPLPFIADDLFVHFDDDRAAAGLEALMELGAVTQVLFFTHHRHLADLAMAIGAGGAARLQKL